MNRLTDKNSPNLVHLNSQRKHIVRTLKRNIRHAEKPDNPELIIRYLKLSNHKKAESTNIQRQLLLAQFYLFIETMADQRLPLQWRCLCLDHIHQPLFALQRLIDSEESEFEVRLLFRHLKVSSEALQADVFA